MASEMKTLDMAHVANHQNNKDDPSTVTINGFEHRNGYNNNHSPDAKNHPNAKRTTNHHHHNNNNNNHYPNKNGTGGESPELIGISSASPTESHMKKFMKNSRKSRSRFGRGLAKKGGAGGKGTWGKICEDYGGVSEALDQNDPNYDSDLDNCKIEAIIPVLEDHQMESYVKPIITEYFEHGSTEEVMELFREVNFGDHAYMVAIIAISLAMERKNVNREMTSILISDLYGNFLHQSDIERAFDVLLETLPDLMLDTPTADKLLGNFIARAVADDCIPPIYVKRSREKYTVKPQKNSLDLANDLLSSKHGLINVDCIWGFNGGWRPVKYLVKEMHMILEEYLNSNLANEAASNLTELEVPHFHHEFVYEALVKAIEDGKERTIDMICKLLKYLFDTCVMTVEQIKNGYLRVFEEMPDIVIDVPFAYDILETIKTKSEKLECFPPELEKEMPTRGRKRFVSEGDGGVIKA